MSDHERKRRELPDYWWYPEASSLALAKRILDAGPGHQLQAVPYVEAGLVKVRFRVLRDGARALEQDINESFPCPPVCPGGGGG